MLTMVCVCANSLRMPSLSVGFQPNRWFSFLSHFFATLYTKVSVSCYCNRVCRRGGMSPPLCWPVFLFFFFFFVVFHVLYVCVSRRCCSSLRLWLAVPPLTAAAAAGDYNSATKAERYDTEPRTGNRIPTDKAVHALHRQTCVRERYSSSY